MERIMRLVCVFCLAVFPMGIAYAQEDAGSEHIDDLQGEDISESVDEEDYESLEFATGTVISVNKSSSEITMSEYDWRSDIDIEVVYSIDPMVSVEGASSWGDIATGAFVEIDYTLDTTGKKVIKSITVSEEEDSEVL